MTQRLDRFTNSAFYRGRPAWVEALWTLASILAVASRLPGSGPRIAILRAFGARIGKGVVIKPGVRVKFPWRLVVGDHSWIGEDAWIDNLATVEIGAHVCVSQGAYLCTGSHDWSRNSFDLITAPIALEQGCWLGAMTRVAPGVTVGSCAVLTIGSTAVSDLPPGMICSGTPAVPTRPRPKATTAD
jgi:putative colanic acid biosynthesis acetyltransferase WcaF